MSRDADNQAFLASCVRRVHRLLERHAARASGSSGDDAPTGVEPMPGWEGEENARPALLSLGERVELTPFELDVLILCAAMELDSRTGALCAKARGDPRRPFPTFGLALAVLPGPQWEALAPGGTLRRLGLVTVEPGLPMVEAQLRVDERLWQWLLGIDGLDERISRHVRPAAGPALRAPSHEELARLVAATCARTVEEGAWPLIQLCGRSMIDQAAVAGRAAELLGSPLHRMPAEGLPTASEEIERLARLWNREVLLDGAALLLDCHELEPSDTARSSAVLQLMAAVEGPLFLSSPERRSSGARRSLVYEVPLPRYAEQRAIWAGALGRYLGAAAVGSPGLQRGLNELVGQFDFDTATIEAATAQGVGQLALEPASTPEQARSALWAGARLQSRKRLESLVQRIEPRATWEELVLPETARQLLAQIELYVRNRAFVHERWGFSRQGWRGTGTSVLFSGPSGTGKTMAAEVLAHQLGLDLYRIDLSAVVSKYIGETEKNLRRIFDAAESGGAVLLFDEADSLFGKRSEVKDSHDRYANIEVSYLLQRMEAFQGLAVLTTNLKSGLDPAFARRLRFIVDFPFPDRRFRAELWRRAFPREVAVGVPPERLAQLNVSGAAIRNIALHAAFLASDDAARQEGPPRIRASHLIAAARFEYEKLQQPLSSQELEGWND